MRKYFKCFSDSLLKSIYVVGAYIFRPHPLALKRYRIRIVELIDDHEKKVDNLSDEAYKALSLLEQYDNEMFFLVKRHIRIICFFSPNPPPSNRPCCVQTSRLYFLNLLYFPVGFSLSAERLPIAIAGLLAYHATLANRKGCLAYFDKANYANVFELCQKSQTRTMQKLEQALRASPESASGTGHLSPTI